MALSKQLFLVREMDETQDSSILCVKQYYFDTFITLRSQSITILRVVIQETKIVFIK